MRLALCICLDPCTTVYESPPARAVAILEGVTVANAPARADVIASITLDRGSAELLEQLAAAAHDGNRSAAVRHLVRVHAGLETERANGAAAVDVDGWRKRSLSRALIGEVATRVRAGMLRADACQACGVTRWQLERWNKQGRADTKEGRSSIYADWVMNLERVEAELRLEQVREVKDPKWLLERQSPETYGKRTVSDATITHRTVPMIDFERLSIEKARLLVELLREASPAADESGISSRARPIGELLPADLDGEASEISEA
jgi:hypothetical protein